MSYGLHLGPQNASARTRENNSESSKKALTARSLRKPQRTQRTKRNPVAVPFSASSSLSPRSLRSKAFRRPLSSNFFPRIDRAPPRRLGDPLASLPRHLHHAHAALEIIRQRLPYSLELLRILRRQHRQTNPSGQDPGRISFLHKEDGCRADRPEHHRFLP